MLIRRPGQAWHALQPALHDERALQTLLAQSPGLLPSPGPGELAVAANFRAPAGGSIDLLGVGVDGRIVLVECGRQEGPGRRSMGGASLAVAAGLWRMNYDDFDHAFAARAGVPLAEAVSTLAQAAGVGWDEAAFRAALTANLAGGRFQLILAVDAVSDEVRRVVAYLNAGARPGLSAVALGLRYLAEDGIEILIPTVYRGDNQGDAAGAAAGVVPGASVGPPVPNPPASPAPAPPAAASSGGAPVATSAPAGPAASAPPPPPPRPAPSPPGGSSAPAGTADAASTASAQTNGQAEAALFDALRGSCLPAAVESVRRLYDLARVRGRELQWGQGEHPSVTAIFDIGGRPVGVWSCYTDLKPSFVVNFEWLVPHVPTEKLQRLADRLGQLQSVPERLAGLAEAGYRRRLALAVNAVLAQPGAADVIAAALSELLEPAGAQASAAPSSPGNA